MASRSKSKQLRPVMQCSVAGVGAWGPGFNNWQDLREILAGRSDGISDQLSGPKPEVIPPNERRRAPLLVRLAVESSWQAIQQAGIESASLGCVFASSLGDTDITGYMCRILNTNPGQLSPTRFHNSVHNAAAGYWTISTGCMQSANSIAGFQRSSSLSLLESVSQCITEDRPVLMSLFDSPVCDVLKPTLVNEYAFATSLVFQADATSGCPRFEFSIDNNPANLTDNWPGLRWKNNDNLNELYDTNPAARILNMLELLFTEENGADSIRMPLSTGTNLLVRRIS